MNKVWWRNHILRFIDEMQIGEQFTSQDLSDKLPNTGPSSHAVGLFLSTLRNVENTHTGEKGKGSLWRRIA